MHPRKGSSKMEAQIAEAIQTEMASPPSLPPVPASVTRSVESTPLNGVSYTPCPPGTKCGHIHTKTRNNRENNGSGQETKESSSVSTPDSVTASTDLDGTSTPLIDMASHTWLAAETDGP